MSVEETENIVKKKLMNILGEELSTLKLKETNKTDDVENLSNYPQNGIEKERDDNKENLGSLDDKTDEITMKTADITIEEMSKDQNEVEVKASEAASPSSKTSAEEIMQPRPQIEEGQIDCKEVLSPEKLKAAHFIQNMSDNIKCTCGNAKVHVSDEEAFVPPPDNLAEKILQRAESYFQDYNLFKNSFLLNHIRRNKHGYISLKLLASLRKIKALTRDSRVVAYCVKESKILELNPESTKVRRIEPISKIEDTSFGKTLMVFNIPRQSVSREFLKELFKKFGTVVSAGIYDIGSPEIDPYHERCLHFHRRISSKMYGIIEFERYDQVVDVLKDEEGYLPKENEMVAVPLMPQIYKKERKHLKFLDMYHGNARRGYEKRWPEDFRPPSGDDIRKGEGGYYYKRGVYRRPYRGRHPFMPGNAKNFSNDYHGVAPKKWGESRHLRASNSLNIDHSYPNTNLKKTNKGYMENGVRP